MKKREERYKKAYYAIVALFVAAILWYALEAGQAPPSAPPAGPYSARRC